MDTNWGWQSTNCWAGVIACIAATLARLLGAESAADPALLVLPAWLPAESATLTAAVAGGAAGYGGALLIDWLRPAR